MELVGDQKFESIGGIEHVLTKARPQAGQTIVDLLQTRPFAFLQVRAIAAEAVEGEAQCPSERAGERPRLGRPGIFLHAGSDHRVAPGGRVESAHQGQRLVKSHSQLGRRGQRFERPHHAERALQRFAELFERRHRVFPGERTGADPEFFTLLFRLRQQLFHRRAHVLGFDLIEGDHLPRLQAGDRQQGIVCSERSEGQEE